MAASTASTSANHRVTSSGSIVYGSTIASYRVTADHFIVYGNTGTNSRVRVRLRTFFIILW